MTSEEKQKIIVVLKNSRIPEPELSLLINFVNAMPEESERCDKCGAIKTPVSYCCLECEWTWDESDSVSGYPPMPEESEFEPDTVTFSREQATAILTHVGEYDHIEMLDKELIAGWVHDRIWEHYESDNQITKRKIEEYVNQTEFEPDNFHTLDGFYRWLDKEDK